MHVDFEMDTYISEFCWDFNESSSDSEFNKQFEFDTEYYVCMVNLDSVFRS